jgi:hypothetical protein
MGNSNLALRETPVLELAPRTRIDLRVDLRTGLPAAGHVNAARRTPEAWIEALSAARDAWTAAGRSQPLSAAAPQYLFEPGEASRLDALLRGAGFAMRSVTIEIDESELAACESPGMEAVERLRARGWGLGLISNEECPLALGSRGRSLFTEVLATAPGELSPAMVLADPMALPLTRRIRAAQGFGLATVALDVKSPAQAGLLIALGFDRGQGPGYRG